MDIRGGETNVTENVKTAPHSSVKDGQILFGRKPTFLLSGRTVHSSAAVADS